MYMLILKELMSYTAGKSVGQQAITVNQFNSTSNIDKCHILFVPFAKTKNMGEVLSALGDKSTLIITEKAGAIEAGSAINFQTIGDKLKFEMKQSNATKYGIKVSAKLAEMAIKAY